MGEPTKRADGSATAPVRDGRFSDDFRAGLLELFRWRRDVRRFRREAVPDALIEELLAQMDLAPSVGNSQPWRIVAVVSAACRRAVRQNFADANARALAGHAGERAQLYAGLKLAGLDEAPLQWAVFVDEGTAQGHGPGRQTMPETLAYSVVMAVHTLWLAARAQGLGVGWLSPQPSRRCSTCRRTGAWSPTCASAGPKKSTPTRSWSAPAGSRGGSECPGFWSGRVGTIGRAQSWEGHN